MPSPILQAQRQGEFLMSYLAGYARDLRDKGSFRPRDFAPVPCNVLVAISDTGIVERPTRLCVDEVCKADQVAEQIRELVESSRQVKRLLSVDELSSITSHMPALGLYPRQRPCVFDKGLVQPGKGWHHHSQANRRSTVSPLIRLLVGRFLTHQWIFALVLV